AAARSREAKATKCDRSRYETITDPTRLDAWLARAKENGILALDTETTSLDCMSAELVGFSIALAPNEAAYIPLAHTGAGDQEGGLFNEGLLPDQMPIREALT